MNISLRVMEHTHTHVIQNQINIEPLMPMVMNKLFRESPQFETAQLNICSIAGRVLMNVHAVQEFARNTNQCFL